MHILQGEFREGDTVLIDYNGVEFIFSKA